MASGNSQEIINYKRKLMSHIVQDEIVFKAINARNESDGRALEPGELYYTHIFPYAFIPQTLEVAGCYINIEVSMPSVSTKSYFFKDVLVIITIICHQDLMQMTDDEPLGATGATRADYLAVQIDKLFNLKKGVVGNYEFQLVSNTEGAIDKVHRCRTMRFKTTEIVKQPCAD